jgi:ribonuclease Z
VASIPCAKQSEDTRWTSACVIRGACPVECPMRAFVEVLGAGNADAAAGLLLFFDDARYLFECGDGTQRYCTERAVRLSRLRGIYLTSLSAPSLGGLLGMVLTIADAGKEKVSIAGPEGISALFTSAQRNGFCYRPAMQTELVSVKVPRTFEEVTGQDVSIMKPYPASSIVCDDANLVIRAVPVPALRSDNNCSSRRENTDCVGKPFFAVVTYVCRMRDIPGKFDPARAIELGVPKGPAFGRLTRGEPFALPDGSVVSPHDVMSSSTPGPVVIVVACPSTAHLDAVVSNPELCPVELGIAGGQGPGASGPVCVVYHRVSRCVLAHPRYKEWCGKFGPRTSHVTLHSSMAPERVVFASQAQDIDHLRSFDSQRFRPSWQSMLDTPTSGQPVGKVAKEVSSSALSFFTDSLQGSAQKWRMGDCGMQFTLAPVSGVGFSFDDVPPKFIDLNEAKMMSQSAEHCAAESAVVGVPLEAEMSDPACVANFDRETAEVCFLGTAAAIPGKHRNVSGILLNLFARGAVMMDCGEGSWGQMTRSYGMDAAIEILRGLKIVFISHIHADHHLGLLTLLYERRRLISSLKPGEHWPVLVIIGPRQLKEWLSNFEFAVYGSNDNLLYRFCDAEALTDPQQHESKFFADSYGLEIACVRVIHCPNSYGVVVLDRLTGWKLVYSGDTRPCRALAEAGSGATLAIHEATLDDSMEAESIAKNHSTTSEAIRVCAEWMGAWRTVLTHFSQRYPRVPLLDMATVRNLELGRAAVAFDLMRINFADLASLPQVMPAVVAAFPEDILASGGHGDGLGAGYTCL